MPGQNMIPVARPRLPPARAIMPYLRQIDANRWYSNHGPLVRLFQSRLATHWEVEQSEVALLSNATTALTLALLASGVPSGMRCLMPSWTFAATAGAVVQAGLVPHFVDVCPQRWTPHPDEIRALAAHHDIGAIMIVAPFGAPVDTAEWERVQTDTGIPVVIDAAAAFDTMRIERSMALRACPMVVSLHATKVFGIGEGGALLSRDPAFMDRVRRMAQFGFLGTREAILPGMNAKLSEYAAAVGLAGLDEWPEARARWCMAQAAYERRLVGVSPSPHANRTWASSTYNVLCPQDSGCVMDALARAGVATLQWWGAGCHAQPAFQACPAEPLPVTCQLARRTIGLPFWQGMTPADIEVVCAALMPVCSSVHHLEAV